MFPPKRRATFQPTLPFWRGMTAHATRLLHNKRREMTMKNAGIAGAAVLVIASATGAFAKEDTGTIKKINKTGDQVTLSDGKVFTLPEGIEAETLKVGARV